ncbi:MAG: fumarylacetoacetate hydrolase family protein [Haloarculaceae archaeon]
MRYFQTRDGDRRLLADDGDAVHDLTAATPRLDSFGTLARSAAVADRSLDAIARRHLDDAPTVTIDPAGAAVPVDAGEVWAAGVTYEISQEARESESESPDVYIQVYESERPELFLKATPSRTVGPGDDVGVRGDSTWDVPEPELGVVLYDGDIVGYTVGNDVSSRSIEGENPLYLPQAKVYDRSCAIGPCVASTDSVDDPHDLVMEMTIERDGDTVYEGATSTGDMVRTCEELAGYLDRHNQLPELAVLLTGTALVPEEGFTLRPGDRVSIDIEEIGTLVNGVRTV